MTSSLIDPTYPCLFCPHKASTRSNLTRHLIKHTKHPEGKIGCSYEGCSYSTNVYKELLDHEKGHSENRRASRVFYCGYLDPLTNTFCPFITRKSIEIGPHRHTHSKNPDTRLYGCHVCDYEGANYESFLYHAASHTVDQILSEGSQVVVELEKECGEVEEALEVEAIVIEDDECFIKEIYESPLVDSRNSEYGDESVSVESESVWAERP